MVVRAGREFLAIPGPTTMPDEVLQAMHRPAMDIYSEQMVQLTDGLLRDLSRLFATKGQSYIYIANGHGAWEAVISNVLSRGDKILVLESGRFAVGWGNAAAAMGVDVEVLKGDWRRAVKPAAVEARLRQDKEHRIKAILAVQVDTAWAEIQSLGAGATLPPKYVEAVQKAKDIYFAPELRARSTLARRVSIMRLPTRWMRLSGTPSARRLRTPVSSLTSRISEMASVTTRTGLAFFNSRANNAGCAAIACA